ncbi:MAG TPA: fumarylacetoacetate hydrolase family protein [Bacillota bacterium]|nr:fumarylacetoacetate hydrolase family protein [Bacillota bacterium]
MLGRAYFKLRGIEQALEGKVDPVNETVEINEMNYAVDKLPFDIPIIGTVYGTLLNDQGAYEALEPSMHHAPYKKPPHAPILYIKPENTLTCFGSPIPFPKDTSMLEVGATLGIVIGKDATRVTKEEALDYVFGYTVVNDVTIPHQSVHRPAVKEKARDGFCPIGPWVMKRDAVPSPNDLYIRVWVNDQLQQENHTSRLVRSVEQLLVDVTEFMTLSAGDLLLVGVFKEPPLVKEHDHVRIEIEGVGVLENRVMKEGVWLGGEKR